MIRGVSLWRGLEQMDGDGIDIGPSAFETVSRFAPHETYRAPHIIEGYDMWGNVIEVHRDAQGHRIAPPRSYSGDFYDMMWHMMKTAYREVIGSVQPAPLRMPW